MRSRTRTKGPGALRFSIPLLGCLFFFASVQLDVIFIGMKKQIPLWPGAHNKVRACKEGVLSSHSSAARPQVRVNHGLLRPRPPCALAFTSRKKTPPRFLSNLRS
jgi:hypothetical protein